MGGIVKRRATQRDVARLAGVSQAAVSIVLTGAGTPSISADTWQRITDAAHELGYVPNRFAQALRTNRSMTIACLVPDITNPFYPALIRGVQSVADGMNYDLITISTDGLAERERHFLDWALQGRVDGVIGVFFTLRAQDLKPLVDGGVPVVRIESSKKRGGEIADRRHLRRQPRRGAGRDPLPDRARPPPHRHDRRPRRSAERARRRLSPGAGRCRRDAACRHRRRIQRDRRHARDRGHARRRRSRRRRSLPPTT